MTDDYIVEFEKLLIRGVLDGLSTKERIHFDSEKEARRWVNDLQRLDKNTEYINFVVSHSPSKSISI